MTGTIETRLYDAIVGESSLSKITKLLEDDIDCNLSHFDLTTLNFVSPIQLAAKKATYRYGTLNLLYKKRNSPTKVQLEKHLTFFCNHYQLSNNEENELLFEFTVCRLLHNRISRYPVQEIHIIIAALFDYDEAKLRGQNLSIGSTHDMFLQVRIYALFQWIVDMKINASMTSESETFSTIESELLHNLEVYYLLHDILQIPVRITDDMNRQRFQQIESSQPLLMKFYRSIAENVINKIEQLRPQQEYTIPTGWRYHAVCVSFRRVDQTRISIRVDNPSRFNPPDMHEIDSSTASTHRIRPKVLGRLNVDNLNDSITTYIIMLIDSVKRDLTPDIAIPLIYDSKKIIKQLDRRQEENVLSFVEQAATNCFVKCFEPGLRIRFGKQQKLCEKLFLQEKNAANQLVNQCEMDSECRVNGSPDRFTRFVRLDDLNRLPLAPNATLQEKLKSSYKQHCRLLSNIMNEECSRPLIERFIDLRFKEENRIVQLRNLFSEPRVLVLGEAGSGKTTVCQYTAYSWACGKLWQSRFDWLFYIRMRNLNSKLYPLRSSK
ncbi:unnamed protein product [Rotaria sp. Silwood2]|nr:unnamed protein product [Rotaria sp. Silwood2]